MLRAESEVMNDVNDTKYRNVMMSLVIVQIIVAIIALL